MTKLVIGILIGMLISVLIFAPVVADLSNTIIETILSSIPTFDNAGAQLLLFGIVIIIYLRQIPLWIWALLVVLVAIIIEVIFT